MSTGTTSLTYDDAVAAVTAPGQPFETAEAIIDGVTVTAFVNAPRSLREIYATARARRDQVFLVYEDERWTFGDVMGHADAAAAMLVQRYGVRRGDRVAIAMRNYPEWVVAFTAITSVGAISVSLNAWWTPDEIDYALEDCGASLLVADAERLERAADSAKRLGVPVVGVRCPKDVGGVVWGDGFDRWEDVLPVGAALPDIEVVPTDAATILYTSGTTGRPKGAVSTHGSITQSITGYACRAAVEQARRGRLPQPARPPAVDQVGTDAAAPAPQAPQAVLILIVPLFHVTGCIPVMLGAFAGGSRLVMMHKWNPERALELIERERVTSFVGVPTQSWDLLESPRFADFDTSSLVSVSGGGAPAPPELVKRVDAGFRRARPAIGYGMTETTGYSVQNSGDDYLTHPTSAGRTTPILQVEVRDPDGKPVPVGEQGEIWFKGPTVFSGYWGKPEATSETIVEGWLRSGDLGRVDEDGFVYVEDRAKDMILRGGENVYCAEVEAAVYEHPAVYEAAVFGLPHERLGEEVAVAVVPRAGAHLDVDELRAFLGARLAAFKVPTRVLLHSEALPRNASGKILKRQLRDDLTEVA